MRLLEMLKSGLVQVPSKETLKCWRAAVKAAADKLESEENEERKARHQARLAWERKRRKARRRKGR